MAFSLITGYLSNLGSFVNKVTAVLFTPYTENRTFIK